MFLCRHRERNPSLRTLWSNLVYMGIARLSNRTGFITSGTTHWLWGILGDHAAKHDDKQTGPKNWPAEAQFAFANACACCTITHRWLFGCIIVLLHLLINYTYLLFHFRPGLSPARLVLSRKKNRFSWKKQYQTLVQKLVHVVPRNNCSIRSWSTSSSRSDSWTFCKCLNSGIVSSSSS